MNDNRLKHMDLKTTANILRRKNKSQYRLLALCQFLAVLMVTAFSIMLNSNTVLNVLPEGGDSRKQMYMIFTASLFGCAMFLLYASGLFFRYKSREIGLFMVLGAKRKQIKSMLEREVLSIGITAGAAGILLALPLDYFLWSLFRLFVPNSEEMAFSIRMDGYLWGVVFFILTLMMYVVKCWIYMKQTNLIDLLYEEHKTEPIHDVKSWYGWVGILLMLAGSFLGYIRDSLFLRYLKMLAPAWTAVIYMLIPLGLYLFLCYTIIRGFGKKSKYRHIISHSMMKFQGRQTVRNMIVITVLTAAGFFAIFYVPTIITQGNYTYNSRTYDYYFHYRCDQNMITMDEIEKMAQKEKVKITKKERLPIATLARDGYLRDYDEKGHVVENYMSPFVEESVVSESSYNRITNQNINISPGKYVFVRVKDEADSIFENFDKDISYLQNPVTKKQLPVSLQEGVKAESEVLYHYFVLNDEDYKKITEGLTFEWQEKMILFNVKNVEKTYSFAKKLYEEIVARSSQNVCVVDGYDRIQKERQEKEQGFYSFDRSEEFQISYNEKYSSDFTTYWKYFPAFRVMDKQDMVTRFAVFLMLFAFISAVVFASVILIAYTRSLSIAMGNRQVYKDVEHLGASKAYLRGSVKNQISKVFFIPFAIGTILIYLFYIMILTFNAGIRITTAEFLVLMADVGVVAAVVLIIYLIYRKTLHKVYHFLGI